MKKKILFLCKKRHTYSDFDDNVDDSKNIKSFGLVNSAELICKELNKYHHIKCKVEMVVDANSIDREVWNYKPDIIILEAIWVTPEKIEEILKLHRSKVFIIRIHSKISFLSYEGNSIEWLKKFSNLSRRYNLEISSNDKSTTDILSKLLDINVLYLPNIYSIDNEVSFLNVVEEDIKEYFIVEKKRDYKDKIVNIGCFGSIRPLKNVLTQAIAAIEFSNKRFLKLNFHVNSKTEQLGDRILKNLRNLFKDSGHSLVEHKWYDYSDFIKVIQKMDYGMQVSFSETFNIVSADFVSNDIPIVVSKEIKYLPEYSYADPNSVEEMCKVLSFFEYHRERVVYHNKLNLKRFSEHSTKHWLSLLKEFQRRL